MSPWLLKRSIPAHSKRASKVWSGGSATPADGIQAALENGDIGSPPRLGPAEAHVTNYNKPEGRCERLLHPPRDALGPYGQNIAVQLSQPTAFFLKSAFRPIRPFLPTQCNCKLFARKIRG